MSLAGSDADGQKSPHNLTRKDSIMMSRHAPSHTASHKQGTMPDDTEEDVTLGGRLKKLFSFFDHDRTEIELLEEENKKLKAEVKGLEDERDGALIQVNEMIKTLEAAGVVTK